jgi:hypothetical protein
MDVPNVTTILTKFDGKVFVQEQPVDLPVGAQVSDYSLRQWIAADSPFFARRRSRLGADSRANSWPRTRASHCR